MAVASALDAFWTADCLDCPVAVSTWWTSCSVGMSRRALAGDADACCVRVSCAGVNAETGVVCWCGRVAAAGFGTGLDADGSGGLLEASRSCDGVAAEGVAADDAVAGAGRTGEAAESDCGALHAETARSMRAERTESPGMFSEMGKFGPSSPSSLARFSPTSFLAVASRHTMALSCIFHDHDALTRLPADSNRAVIFQGSNPGVSRSRIPIPCRFPPPRACAR